jgi:outer membrane PBP1 activator LpoA protein
MLLILPAQSTAFARQAEPCGRASWPHARPVATTSCDVVEVGAGAQTLSGAVAAAGERGAAVIVGPLPRSEVSEVIEGGTTTVPLVALNFPESDGIPPASTLALGLSLEAEAQRMARIALAEFVAARGTDTRPRIAIIARAGALERRIAQAFQSALRAEGEVPRLVEWAPDSRGRWRRTAAMPLEVSSSR